MNHEDRLDEKDSYSTRPSLFRAVGITSLSILMWTIEGSRGVIGVLAALTAAAWLDFAGARRRSASLQHGPQK